MTRIICDRCGRVPVAVAGPDLVPYCHCCQHECSFTNEELEAEGVFLRWAPPDSEED
jgi:hypothetical protein